MNFYRAKWNVSNCLRLDWNQNNIVDFYECFGENGVWIFEHAISSSSFYTWIFMLIQKSLRSFAAKCRTEIWLIYAMNVCNFTWCIFSFCSHFSSDSICQFSFFFQTFPNQSLLISKIWIWVEVIDKRKRGYFSKYSHNEIH